MSIQIIRQRPQQKWKPVSEQKMFIYVPEKNPKLPLYKLIIYRRKQCERSLYFLIFAKEVSDDELTSFYSMGQYFTTKWKLFKSIKDALHFVKNLHNIK